jgi:Carboxypeptidase regulatory-like domain
MNMSGSLALILVFAVPLTAQAAPVEHTEKSAIEGVVAAGGGEPLAEAEVSISREGASEPPLVARTDAAGHYAVGDLEPGRYSLFARHSGYVSQEYGQRRRNGKGVTLILERGKKLRGVDFRLIATGVIAGRVLGENDEPRVRAYVQACTSGYREGQRRLTAAAGLVTTNDLGEYRIYGLAPGRYYVGVLGQDPDPDETVVTQPAPPEERYLPTLHPNAADIEHAVAIDVQPASEARGIDIVTLTGPTFHVRGKILEFDPSAQGTRVSLRGVDGVCDMAAGGEQGPSAQGNFDFGAVTPGTYVVSTTLIYKENFESASRLIRVVDGDVGDVNLAPIRGFELRGRVRVEGGKRLDLHKLSLGLSSPHSPAEPAAQQPTSDGSFVFHAVGPYVYQLAISGLPADFYLKSVRLGDQQIAGATIDLANAEGAPRLLEIVLSGAAGTVDGMVKDDKDQAASDAVVVLVPDSQESDLFQDTTTDQNGRFTIRGVRPGDYKLFTWDDVEPGAWWDPEFLSHYEAKGEDFKVEASGHLSVNLHLISTNPE